jgi:hypothetical protein
MADDFGSWLLAGLTAPLTGGMSLAQQGSAVSAEKRQREYEKQAEEARKRKKDLQLQGIDQLQAPGQSEATKRRIAAMEAESGAPTDTSFYDTELGNLAQRKANVYQGPASQDPLYAAKQLQLARQGAQGVAGVMNRQAQAGLTGGFQNVGSAQDIQDRLAGATASLAQDQEQFREGQRTQLENQRLAMAQGKQQFTLSERERRRQLADQSALMQQSIADSTREFENLKVKARQAAEIGDVESALELSRQALAAKDKAEQAQLKFYGNVAAGLTQAGGAALGAAIGGPQGAQAGSAAGKSIGGGMQAIDTSSLDDQKQQVMSEAFEMPSYDQDMSEFGYGRRPRGGNTYANTRMMS